MSLNFFKRTLLLIYFIAISNNFLSAQCSKFKDISTSGALAVDNANLGFHFTAIGIKEDGSIWTWGNNVDGQLGDGTYLPKSNPTRIGNEFNWKKAIIKGNMVWALKNDGSIWRWGNKYYNNFISNSTRLSNPTRFGLRNDWKDIAVGESHVLAISNDSKLWSWGSSYFGALGNGLTSPNIYVEDPLDISNGMVWDKIFCVINTSFAINNIGELFASGRNLGREIPDGTNISVSTFKKIQTNYNFINIVGGFNGMFALTTDNKLMNWNSGTTTIGINLENQYYYGKNIKWIKISLNDKPLLLDENNDLYYPSNITGDFVKIEPNLKWKMYDNNTIFGQSIDEFKLFQFNFNNYTYYNKSLIEVTPYSLSNSNNSKTIVLNEQSEYFDLGCDQLIARTNSSQYDIRNTGNLTAKVWVEPTQNKKYVKRYYQLNHSANNTSLNSQVTLYFNKQEFDDFSLLNENKLPNQTGDNWGKANLRIKYIPLSTLEPNSISFDSQNFNIIDPNDSEIIFNSAYNRWEITFLTTGFGAYFITNNDIVIRNDCSYFKKIFTNAGAYNAIGQKEDGTLWEITENPIMISDKNDWVDFSFGDHYMGMDKNGQLWAWGSNNYGQLGDGTTNYSNVPIPIGLPNQWKKFSAGFEFSIAIDNQNKLWTWGRNEISSYTNFDYSSSPRLLEGTLNWQTVDAGILRPVATTADNLGWQWGYALTNIPVLIDANLRWKVLKSGNLHLLGITTDGKAWGKGDNEYGQLGIGNNFSTSVPIQIGNQTNWVDISPGRTFGLGKTSDNKYWGWGYNYEGTVGNGTTTQTLSPAYISNKFIKIGGANKQSFALDSLGDIWVWGYSNSNIIIPKPYRISNKIKPRVLPVLNVSFTNNNLGLINYLGDCDNLISKIIQSPNENIDINSKVWVNPNLPFNYVKRHYELSSSNSINNSSKSATLYFTNEEFLNYNSKNTRKLPISNSDIVGISNIRVKTFNGNSSDNSGSPFSYNFTSRIINPIDTNIFWNSEENRWEISFDLENFGGYFLGSFTQCNTTKSGDWNDPTVWSCGVVPTNLDDAIISATHIITMPDNYTGQANNLENNGNLIFGQNATLNLTGQ